ncbi:YciI family protein, partial [Pseudomonas aeruginosa]
LIVAEFDSLAAAQSWAEADPYLAAGAGRAQGLETDLALQTGRRRG